MDARSDAVTKAIDVAIAEAHYEGRSLVIYLLNLALMAAQEEARKARPAGQGSARS